MCVKEKERENEREGERERERERVDVAFLKSLFLIQSGA